MPPAMPYLSAAQRAATPAKRVVDCATWDKMDYDEDRISNLGGVMHSGKLKAFLNELHFLTQNARPGDLVIRSATGTNDHMGLLADMFPGVEFHVYDSPCVNTAIGRPNVLHIQRRLCYPDARERATDPISDRTLFICDTRTVEREWDPVANKMVAKKDAEMTAARILSDLALQRTLLLAICPRAALLKFRLPYGDHGEVEYLDGDIHVQPFSQKGSSEARLHVRRNQQQRFPTKRYIPGDYERAMFHYNMVDRRAHFDKPHGTLSHDQELAQQFLGEWAERASEDMGITNGLAGRDFVRGHLERLDRQFGKLLSLRDSHLLAGGREGSSAVE